MALTAEKRNEVREQFGRDAKDSGSPEVQIAMLTEKINHLQPHMRQHRQDHASRRGLLTMVSQRNKLLKYLARTDRPKYLETIGRLGLRK